MKARKIFNFFSKILICIIVTLSCMIILKSNSNLRGLIYKKVFQNNFKFAKVNELYEKYFGVILPFSKNNNVSLVSKEEIEYESKEEYKDGVRLKVSENYPVPLLNSGIVIFIGNKEGYGDTVIVQDADGVETWYANLKMIKVSMYDYLKKGDIVGEASGDNFILVFTKDGKIIDYKKYI
ncbi:MAG: M23 family metallopeptidase [Bacilli bacterium]|nr:M23 family metallopeptidase [Bacilli bacterium]